MSLTLLRRGWKACRCCPAEEAPAGQRGPGAWSLSCQPFPCRLVGRLNLTVDNHPGLITVQQLNDGDIPALILELDSVPELAGELDAGFCGEGDFRAILLVDDAFGPGAFSLESAEFFFATLGLDRFGNNGAGIVLGTGQAPQLPVTNRRPSAGRRICRMGTSLSERVQKGDRHRPCTCFSPGFCFDWPEPVPFLDTLSQFDF